MKVKQAASESAEAKEAERTMVRRVCGGEVEADQESAGSSSEEMDSPRSVAKVLLNKWSNNNAKNIGVRVYLHNQILRIIAEDSNIGEDFGKVLNWCAKDDKQQLASVVLLSRPILPASPLSGKNTIKTVD